MGTRLPSLRKRERLDIGYPTRDPKTGKITIHKTQPKTGGVFQLGTHSLRPKPKPKPKKKVSVRDAALARSATRKQYRSR